MRALRLVQFRAVISASGIDGSGVASIAEASRDATMCNGH